MSTKDKPKRDYMVECTVTGRAAIYVTAYNEANALEMAKSGDWDDSELIEWSIDEPRKAELNE